MDGLKEGIIICSREWNRWNNEYSWEFQKIKKITPTGKIRLENGNLISSLGKYNVFNKEMEKLFIEDEIKKCVKSMLFYMNSNKNNIFADLQIEEVINFGNLLEQLKIENIDKWGSELNKKYYKDSLDDFIKRKSEIK